MKVLYSFKWNSINKTLLFSKIHGQPLKMVIIKLLDTHIPWEWWWWWWWLWCFHFDLRNKMKKCVHMQRIQRRNLYYSLEQIERRWHENLCKKKSDIKRRKLQVHVSIMMIISVYINDDNIFSVKKKLFGNSKEPVNKIVKWMSIIVKNKQEIKSYLWKTFRHWLFSNFWFQIILSHNSYPCPMIFSFRWFSSCLRLCPPPRSSSKWINGVS